MAHQLTTCTFCGVGCGIYLETSHHEVIGTYPSVSHPTNSGRICVRGWHVHEIASSPGRLTSPLLRKNGQFQEISWDAALSLIAARLGEIRARHGPDALAFLNSPRCSNEEAYLLQKFARAVIGTNNVDHGAGVFCNNSIDVLLEMIGVPATTNSVSELASSEVIVVDSVDLGRRMPTIGGAVLRAKLHGSRLVVIGTRRHRIAENADLFLQIKPGTEVFLYGAMAKVIEDRGLMNLPFLRTRCRGYEAFRAQVRTYDLMQAAEVCGVAADVIEAAAILYARARAAAWLYTTGAEARRPDVIRSLVNLVLLTGNLGKEGAGIFALTEQNNLQGVCDMGVLPDRLPGYAPVGDDAARASCETAWKAKLPSTPGLGTRAVLRGHTNGVKALWLGRYDPVSAGMLRNPADSLRRFEFVVAQHPFMSDASQHADLVLPTTAYGEERVSFTSTERRIQLAEQVVAPPAGPMPAWQQLMLLARQMGADWNYQSSADVMKEIAEVVPFYSGADYDNLAQDYGRQWPCTRQRPLGTPRLFANGEPGPPANVLSFAGVEDAAPPFKFIPVAKPALAAAPADYPLTLLVGYSLYYWNRDVLIRHSETLNREYHILLLDYPDGFIEMNPEDAKALKIRDGDRVQLRTATTSALSTVRLTVEARRGAVYVPCFVPDVEEQISGGYENGGRLIPIRVEKEPS